MKKKRRTDPEVKAQWAADRRRLAQRIEELGTEIREAGLREERRRARLRRLTFGLLGRA